MNTKNTSQNINSNINNVNSFRLLSDPNFRSQCGQIFKGLRIAKDLTLIEAANIVGINKHYINKIENGDSSLKLNTFLQVCEGYNISPSEIIDLAHQIPNNSTFQEVLCLCAKHESMKQIPRPQITNNEITQKSRLILKAMRVTQGKTLREIESENILKTSLSRYETGEKPIQKLKCLKNYTHFFQISDEDLTTLYNVAIHKNLSYSQILYYCLLLDIARNKSQNNKDNSYPTATPDTMKTI